MTKKIYRIPAADMVPKPLGREPKAVVSTDNGGTEDYCGETLFSSISKIE